MSNEKMLHELAVEEIRIILSQKQYEGLKLVENEAKTGISFFQGKKRLCKVLKTKRGLRIELNVKLPKDIADIDGMETISAAVAHKKHLGTMKHIYKGTDTKMVKQIMTAAVKQFKAELEEDKNKEEVAQ